MTEFRHALRMLTSRPAFAAVAVLTLAVGIGVNTAIFTVVDAVLLRPLPYPQADRIVTIYERSAKLTRNSVSYPNFRDWRDRSRSFEAMALFASGPDSVLGGSEPVFAQVAVVTNGFFSVFGVSPEVGRTFVPEEMRVGGAPAAVVSRRFWEQRLSGRRDLGNLHVTVEGMSLRVVGVMPASFDFPARTDVWFPKELAEDTSGRTSHGWTVVGRLKPDVPLARAAAELNTIAAELKREYGNDDNAIGTTTDRLQDSLARNTRSALILLLGAVGLVLLIACANVASTMLARGEERRMELAVRAALGAGRGRLIRQLLVESLTIGLAGAAGGLLLGGWLVRVLRALEGSSLPAYASVTIDGRVLAFTLALGIVTPLVFGLIPALQVSHPELRGTLAEGSRQGAAPSRSAVRNALVAAEVAIALLLLVGASLLIRSFGNVLSVDPGFDPRGVITAQMSLPQARYDDPNRAAAFYAELLQRVRALPGVKAAGTTNQLPLSGNDFGGAFSFIGTSDPGAIATNDYDGYKFSAPYHVVTPGYDDALGSHIVQGRAMNDGDRIGRPAVAVVNEAFVHQFLPNTNPLGVRLQYAGMDPVNPELTIVGVVSDVHQRALVADSAPTVFVSMNQAPFRARFQITLLARLQRPEQGASVAAALRRVVREADPDIPIEMSTMENVVSDSLARQRFLLVALGAFAAVALLLASTGIYSVLSHVVAERTREVGVRMALGADATRVVRLMLGNVLLPVGIGAAAGAAAAAGTTRLLGSFLFEVRPLDPAAFAAAVVVLVGVALVAGYVPARRATRVDPVRALRS
jgi:predicted permease